MNTPTDPDLIGLLLLVNRLQQTERPLGHQTIVPLAELKLPRVAQKYEALMSVLYESQLIEGDAGEFVLTPAGLEVVGDIAQRHSLHAWFYNEYYQAILHSKAHSLFCERVYGKDLGQHGMADMSQIRDLLSELAVKPGQTILDFGCGDGRISEYIVETTGTFVSGVDVADQAIQLAQTRTRHKRDHVQFYWADIEKQLGYFPARDFDRILAIDSLFFVQDQVMVTRLLLNHLAPAGQLGVFYICPPATAAAATPFAKGLAELGRSYRVKDFSTRNTEHWLKKKQVLLELEPLFKEEGNEFLFKNRLAECDGLDKFQRYLYIITPSSPSRQKPDGVVCCGP